MPALAAAGALVCAAAQDGAAHSAQDQPAEVVEIDLSGASPEVILEPAEIFLLPFDEFPDQVVVAAAQRKAYAASTLVAINIFSLAATLWPEALALSAALASLWWFRRTLRRRQQVGRTYCRRCNYELTNLRGEVCPECGTVLRPAMRAAGRRRWPRLVSASLIFLVAAGMYGWKFRAVPRHVWPEDWPAWWSETLDDVAAANAKYAWLIQHSSVLSRLHEINLDGGGESRILWTGRHSGDETAAIALSSDGSRLCAWHGNAIRVWSLPQRRIVREITFDDPLLAPNRGGAKRVEFSADGRTALVVGPAPQFTAQAIDLDTAAELWRIERFIHRPLSDVRLLRGDDFSRLIVAGEAEETGESYLAEWYIDARGQGQLMRGFATSAHSLGPRLARNGFGRIVWASDLETVEAWNLQTERVEQRLSLPQPVALLAAWPSERERLIITMFGDASRTWIVDAEAGRVLAQLSGEPMRVRGTQILDGGRTLALWGYSGDLARRLLLLYDLQRIAENEREN